jgi:peptide/nickel transport system substrate-binding protein
MKKNNYIKIIILVFTLTLFMGCKNEETAEEDIEVKNIIETPYSEAPILFEEVKKGNLPPAEERLPENPMLIQPVDQIGKYGGTWNIGIKKAKDHAGFIRYIGYENLVRWDPSWSKVIPNIAQSFKVENDSKDFVFTLRKGMKWSDGMPFTADDIMFWYEDVFMNEELESEDNAWLFTKGDPVTVEKIDDYTIKFKFSAPYGLFLQNLATVIGAEPTSYPKHYLSQFHPKYNPEIDKLIEEEGVNNWKELFKKKFGQWGYIDFSSRWQNPELPTLNTWTLKTVYGEGDHTLAKRNPYYWKIDTEGNQLPYIDEVYYYTMENGDEILELALEGKLDMQNRHVGRQSHKKRLDEKSTSGQYGYFQTVASDMNTALIQLNLTHKDPIKREVFQNKNFRIGLSYGINRQAIINEILGGEGISFQTSPRPESNLYNEEMATQYTEYDPKKANEYLNKAGYNKKDNEGYRLGPDRKRISFQVDTIESSTQGTDWKSMFEKISEDWKTIGIEMKVNIMDRESFYTKKGENLHDAVVWSGDGGLDALIQPRYYFPYNYESNFANQWALWYTSGREKGEEPPEQTKKQMELYTKIKEESDQEKQNELMKEILDIAKEEFYIIGISLAGEGFGIVKNNFHNVPEIIPDSWSYPTVSPTNPCQYFID